MKKMMLMGFCLILITLLSTGCGQQEPVSSTPTETQAPDTAAACELPEAFTGDWTGVDGFLHVRADASVTAPYGLKLPTAAVKKKQITQEMADQLMDAFIGEAGLWRYKPGKREGSAGNDRITIPRTFEQRDPFGERISGCAEVDGNIIRVGIENADKSSARFWREDYGNGTEPNLIPMSSEFTISQEAAAAPADAFLHRLGLNHYICQSAAAVTFAAGDPSRQETGYDLFYVPSVNQIPAKITENAWGTSTPDHEHIEESWGYEWIRICTNASGEIVYFQWVYPEEAPVITEASAPLLPFAQIAEAFPSLIMTVNAQLSEHNVINGFDMYTEIQVDQAELNLMRIRDKYNYEEGTFIPVWDFRATVSCYTEDETHPVDTTPWQDIVLTINALDGTIIDRQLGY